MRPEMNSPGAISYLNARVGKTDGPWSRVAAIQGLRSVPNTPIGGSSSVTCHGTLIMTDGTTDAGSLSVTDPGGAAPLEVSWESDADRARPDASQPQVAATAPQTADPTLRHKLGVSSADSDPELLPEVISGVMEPLADNVCPRWDSTTRAKEMIVYLTGAIKVSADATRDLMTNSSKAPPEAAAGLARMISENQIHAKAVTACRDAIAEKLGMDSAAVRQLYDYNTLTAKEAEMFSELEGGYKKSQPNYFSKLLAMSDQRRALHLIDLEIKDLDFGIAQWLSSIDHDAGKPTEGTDREFLARDTSFRQALVVVRTSIAKKLDNAAPPRSRTEGAQGTQAVTQAVENEPTKATSLRPSKNPRIHCEVSGESEEPMTIEEGKRTCEAAVEAASLSEESDRVDHVEMKIHSGFFGYDLYIHYKKEGFSGVWAGQEVATAYGDDYHLASEFVKQLVKSGRDPSAEPNQKYVGACAEEDGFTTITGKPGIKLLGCAQYDPYKDAVDPDHKPPAGQ
jgi:hypothetical protein